MPSLLSAFLENRGDCIVVVDDDEIIKVHVHTNDPGKALQYGFYAFYPVHILILSVLAQYVF